MSDTLPIESEPLRLHVDTVRHGLVSVAGTRSSYEALLQQLHAAIQDKSELASTISPETLLQLPVHPRSVPDDTTIVFSLESSDGGKRLYEASRSAARGPKLVRVIVGVGFLFAFVAGYLLGHAAA